MSNKNGKIEHEAALLIEWRNWFGKGTARLLQMIVVSMVLKCLEMPI